MYSGLFFRNSPATSDMRPGTIPTVTFISLARPILGQYNAKRVVNRFLGANMGFRRIKIIVTLLAVAAIAAAFFLRPKRFHVDKTQYDMIPVTDPNGSPLQVIAINSSGQMVASPSVRFGGIALVYTIDPAGRAQALPIPKEYRASQFSINDRGAIVGTVSDPNDSTDAFYWDPQQGFQLVPVRAAFPNADTISVRINNKGIIAGCWERKKTYSKGVFLYDPNEGVFDIEPLSQIAVSIGGLTEDGVIVGGFQSPSGHHAFLWTRRQGLVDIHPSATHYTNSRAWAINDNGWILIRPYDKDKQGEMVLYHHQLGKSHLLSWNYTTGRANSIPLTDRFTVVEVRSPWSIGRYQIRTDKWNNWILEPDRKPILINPKELSDKRWFIVGMDDQGIIVGNTFGLRDAPVNPMPLPEGFILRPIRSGDSGKK
jgi:hypothetical protein